MKQSAVHDAERSQIQNLHNYHNFRIFKGSFGKIARKVFSKISMIVKNIARIP